MASSQLRALVLSLALNCAVGLQVLPQNASLTEASANKTQMAAAPVNETDTDEEATTMEDVSQERTYIKHMSSELQALVQSDDGFAKSELGSDVESFVNALDVSLNETASIADPVAAKEKLDAFGDGAENLLHKVKAKREEVPQKMDSNAESFVLEKIAGVLSGEDEEPTSMEDVYQKRTYIKQISSGLSALVQSDESFAKSEIASDVKSFVNTLEVGLKETASTTDPVAAMDKLEALGGGEKHLLRQLLAKRREAWHNKVSNAELDVLEKIIGFLYSGPSQ